VHVLDHREQLTSGGRLDTPAPTLVRVTVAGTRVTEGTAVAFTAQVVTVHRDGPVPSGTVAFRAGHRLLGTAPLDGAGTAVLGGIRLPAGVHAVVASYGGDPAHAPATSAPVPQPVVAAATPVNVAVSEPRRGPREVVLHAQLLDPVTGQLVVDARGSVTFALEGRPFGSTPVEGGDATLVLPTLPPGQVTARFHGDPDHAASDGATPASPAP
jgi:hypothetical protein